MDLADGAALKALATIVNPHHQHGIDIVALVKVRNVNGFVSVEFIYSRDWWTRIQQFLSWF